MKFDDEKPDEENDPSDSHDQSSEESSSADQPQNEENHDTSSEDENGSTENDQQMNKEDDNSDEKSSEDQHQNEESEDTSQEGGSEDQSNADEKQEETEHSGESEGQSLFRKEAKESRESDIDLGPMMVVVSPKIWVGLITILSIVLIVVVWSIFGMIPEEVHGKGIVLNKGTNYTILSKEEGVIEQIFVSQGDLIQAGDALAIQQNPEIHQNYHDAQKHKELVSSQMVDFKVHHFNKIVAEKEAILTSIHADELEIKRVETEIKFLDQELCWLSELHEKGLIALPQLNHTQERLNNKKKQRDGLIAGIKSNNAKLKGLEDILQMQEFQTRLKHAESRVDDLKIKKDQLTFQAPHTGRVLAVSVKEKEYIPKGKAMFWLERDIGVEPRHVVYGYFDSKKDQRIKKGMIAQIRLGSVDYNRYGSLIAEVEEVWGFPSSSKELNNLIGNNQLVNFLNKSGSQAPIQVVFRPIKNDKTPSGFSWTSKNGPPFEISTGTLGDIKVTIRAKRPIEFVFPIFRTIRDSTKRMKVERNRM